MIVPVIEDIVSQLTGPPVFITGRKAYANVLADDLNYNNGVVFLYTPLQSSGITNEKYKVLMFFAIKHELMDPDTVIRTKQNQMKALSQQFLLRLQKYEDGEGRTIVKDIPENSVIRTETENEYEVCLCGILMQFDLIPHPYASQCIV